MFGWHSRCVYVCVRMGESYGGKGQEKLVFGGLRGTVTLCTNTFYLPCTMCRNSRKHVIGKGIPDVGGTIDSGVEILF